LTLKAKRDQIDKAVLLKYFEKMENAVGRITRIVEGLRTFSHLSIELELLDTGKEIESILSMVKELFDKDSLTVHFENLANGPLLIQGNHGRFQQVLMNLLANARDATEGQVKREIRVVLEGLSGDVVIRVIDNGCGIPDDVRARMFEPFFTTKAVDKGTGIGLSMCHSIVQEYKDSISVSSKVGKGTESLLEFPRVSGGVLNMKKQVTKFLVNEDNLQKYTDRVLLVDDEGGIVELLAELLQERSLEVTCFHNGKEVYDHWSENKDRYQFLLTDIKMLIMSGLELTQKITQHGGKDLIKVLMTAGVNMEDTELLADKYGADEDLLKPYTDEQVFEIFDKYQKSKVA
jgi:CheY-like chemotaxis protein